MKTATMVFGLLTMMSVAAPLRAADPGAGQVVMGFTGGATWTDATTGVCVWHFPVLWDMETAALYSPNSTGTAVPDREHSYLIWVSDFTVEPLAATAPHALAVVPEGTATVYFRPDPTHRDFNDRTTWGSPVATFARKAAIIRSPDGFASDTFIFSAELVSSMPFVVNGKVYDFRKMVPNGMTCFEYGQQGSSWEAGSCVAAAKQ